MTDASRPDGAPQDVEGASRSAGASTDDSINQAADPSTDSPSIQLLPDLDPASIPIRIHDMTIAYHRKPVLWDVDLDVPEGQLVGIVGPNGAGKSTMILAIMNLVPKASGWVRIYGKPYEEMRRIVGYVPQRESVDWDFPISALEVVTMGRFGHVDSASVETGQATSTRGPGKGGHGRVCPSADQPVVWWSTAASLPGSSSGSGCEGLPDG